MVNKKSERKRKRFIRKMVRYFNGQKSRYLAKETVGMIPIQEVGFGYCAKLPVLGEKPVIVGGSLTIRL